MTDDRTAVVLADLLTAAANDVEVPTDRPTVDMVAARMAELLDLSGWSLTDDNDSNRPKGEPMTTDIELPAFTADELHAMADALYPPDDPRAASAPWSPALRVNVGRLRSALRGATDDEPEHDRHERNLNR